MYGNDRLPGVAVSETYRNKGSIWQGAPEATWFKTVGVKGTEGTGTDIPVGTIMKELEDGSYAPIEESDIVSLVADLPGARLVIVADKTAKTGTTVDGEEVSSSVLVGTCGKVDRARVYVADKAFSDLTEVQRLGLNLQLEAWGFQLVNVMQA